MIWQIGIEPSEIIKLAPDNPLLYGFVIILLLAAIYYLHRQNENKGVYLEKQNDRMHEALEAVTVKLQEIKNHAERKDITDSHIYEFLKELKQKLERNDHN